LREEIGEDQEVLQGLSHNLGAAGGAVRNTTAFLSEKLARIKLLLKIPQVVNWHDSRSLKHSPWELKVSEHFGTLFLL
jgi:hypothetical protein